MKAVMEHGISVVKEKSMRLEKVVGVFFGYLKLTQ